MPSKYKYIGETGERKPKDWSLSEVLSVGIKPKDYTLYTGGMQERVEVAMRSGEPVLLVLQKKKRDEAVRELKRIAGLP